MARTAPVMASTVATTLLAALAGYYIGKSSGLRAAAEITRLQQTGQNVASSEFLPLATPAEKAITEQTKKEQAEEKEKEEGSGSEDDEDDSDSDSDSDSDEAGVLSYEDLGEDCKMVFVVRTDLGMTKGKIAAQCGHAALMCYKSALRSAPGLIQRWETMGQTKIAVQNKGGEEELLELQAKAMSLGVVAKIVHDAGRTQIAAGSATVLGLGPAPRSVVDGISGHLKLL